MVRCGNCGGGLWGRLALHLRHRPRWRLGQQPGRCRRWVGQSCRWGRWGMDKRWRWRWGMGQPPWLWRWRCMGQSLIGDFTGRHCGAPSGQSLGQPLLGVSATRIYSASQSSDGLGSHAPYSPDHFSSLRTAPPSFSRARYSSTRSRLPSPARWTTRSNCPIDATSSNCSLMNHWRKLSAV